MKDLILTRDVDAPADLVFEVWVHPKHLSMWWGPEGFTNPRCELDVRPGGAIRIDMRGPDGTVYPMGGFFQEIVVGEKLVFSTSALDGLGHPLFDVLNTITFASRGDSTRLTVGVHLLRTTEDADPYLQGMEAGWKQSLDRLEQYVRRVCTE